MQSILKYYFPLCIFDTAKRFGRFGRFCGSVFVSTDKSGVGGRESCTLTIHAECMVTLGTQVANVGAIRANAGYSIVRVTERKIDACVGLPPEFGNLFDPKPIDNATQHRNAIVLFAFIDYGSIIPKYASTQQNTDKNNRPAQQTPPPHHQPVAFQSIIQSYANYVKHPARRAR